MDIDEVKDLIYNYGECDYLDFKEEDYHKDNKVELVKDLVAFANSHSERNKYIIIGIKEENNLCDEIIGIDEKRIRDEAEFQQIVKTYIKENLNVEYKILNIDNKKLLIIEIPASNNENRPFMVKTQIGYLKENEIYIRKGSMTTLANKMDLEIMLEKKKRSQLIIQSYLNDKISNKLLLSNVNLKIEEYRERKFKEIEEAVNEINSLKGEKYSFYPGDILISNETIKIDDEKEKYIKETLNDLGLELENWTFEFKNIRWRTSFNGGGLDFITKTLDGDKNEIRRYKILEDLDIHLLEYVAIKYYCEGTPQIYSANLVLSNIGSHFDEDIELRLIIDKNALVKKETLIVNDNACKYLGNMYEDLKNDLIFCPRVSYIDEYYQPVEKINDALPYISPLIGKMHNGATYLDKLADKADEFKYDVEQLYDNSVYEENDKIIIKINFKKLMQNKSMFITPKLLFKTSDVKIDYEIRSKNNPKVVKKSIST